MIHINNELTDDEKIREENRFLIVTLAMHKGAKIPPHVTKAFMNGSAYDRAFYLNNVLPENEERAISHQQSA